MNTDTPRTDAVCAYGRTDDPEAVAEIEMIRDHARDLERELNHIQNIVLTFVEKHSWAADLWKRQPHIAPLFEIASKLNTPQP